MNVYSTKLTTQAEEHLREIAWYISVKLNSPDAASNLIDDFYTVFGELSTNPERHNPVAEEPWRSEGIRFVEVGNYYVYFWIDIENAAVQVIGIMYKRQDQKKFFDNL
ncbi:MAG: type II toxin-antitoxin system RelE/ParE family toxin [Pseudobutyrivibrio sp.]|nr:type II toxin-antitoxin system RelE/ParE family toxin [Pseudobutyrivibrio sp.]